VTNTLAYFASLSIENREKSFMALRLGGKEEKSVDLK